jgi:hypothetical protein
MLIDEPQLSSPVEGTPRGSRNRNNICYYEGETLKKWLRSMGRRGTAAGAKRLAQFVYQNVGCEVARTIVNRRSICKSVQQMRRVCGRVVGCFRRVISIQRDGRVTQLIEQCPFNSLPSKSCLADSMHLRALCKRMRSALSW